MDPQWRELWRKTYAAVLPAYHQNKEHWNTVVLDGSIPDDVIKRMIAESYDLVTDSPTKRIYDAIRARNGYSICIFAVSMYIHFTCVIYLGIASKKEGKSVQKNNHLGSNYGSNSCSFCFGIVCCWNDINSGC